MSRTILVGGAGGFIGGHLVKALASRGHTVRAVDIKPLEQWYQKIDGVENVVANLEEKELAVEDGFSMRLAHASCFPLTR